MPTYPVPPVVQPPLTQPPVPAPEASPMPSSTAPVPSSGGRPAPPPGMVNPQWNPTTGRWEQGEVFQAPGGMMSPKDAVPPVPGSGNGTAPTSGSTPPVPPTTAPPVQPRQGRQRRQRPNRAARQANARAAWDALPEDVRAQRMAAAGYTRNADGSWTRGGQPTATTPNEGGQVAPLPPPPATPMQLPRIPQGETPMNGGRNPYRPGGY